MLTERMRQHLIPIATIVTLAVVIAAVGINYATADDDTRRGHARIVRSRNDLLLPRHHVVLHTLLSLFSMLFGIRCMTWC